MSGTTSVNRRTLLRWGAGAGLAVAAAPLLAACGDGGTAAKAEAKNAKLLPTTTVRNIGIKADLPGTAAGVPNAFLKYPRVLARATEGTPLKGAKKITAVTETFAPLPPGRGKNAAWREIEKLLGTQVDFTAVPADDYPAKFSTMVAGDQLPDIFMYPETGGVDNMGSFLAAKCAELGPHLSGDKVKDYPNLAAIPQYAWRDAIKGGKLYGVPIARSGSAGAGFYRADLFKQAGVTSLDQIDSIERLVELAKDLTDARNKQYFFSGGGTTLLAMSAGAQHFWKFDRESGKWTYQLEDDKYRYAVETAAKLYKAGCYYPGTVQMSGAQKAQYTDLFKNGKAAYVFDGMPAYLTTATGYVDAMAAIDKSFDVRPMVPVGKDAVTWTDNVSLQNCYIRRASEQRVKELLRLADFAASPFGSLEYTLVNYGVENVDYQRDENGTPVLTKQGTQDVTVPWGKLASATPAFFSATHPEAARYVHEAYSVLIPKLIEDPTLSYSSPTWDSKGLGSLYTIHLDGLKDLVTGRKPLSAYDSIVKQWRNAGGDKCRAEFEQASQKGKK
ncbi:extracellular solute-binding protein [Streptomyces sp. 6-11-2]|uniref:extracellular solute-binding protein n=1 Tax=Streptomyces sp. 6-11-2 TaxID=2585753 RepID=UPI001144D9CA|nr:extracellular solute-binding protein [Streptomyces sp. 6-11-2]GED90507.1 sugar ABC transporter substrate-binding protein [Streptomyces sp. 6-11-2]